MPRTVARLSRLAVERVMSSHDQIAAILGTEILKGLYRPGANLPPEAELIERFEVSRTVM
ncbi:MAG: GntR family transcriptional regulator, partial [Sinobacteraceae bacterium]|nr:GntR family transcriptional regulator [Nevskiaceae bacterium]